MGRKISGQKKAGRALCPVQVANSLQLTVHEVAVAMRAADVVEQLAPQQAREWMKDPAAAPQWFLGLLAESAARQAQRIAREEREELERRHRLVVAEEKVTRRLLAGAKHFRSPEQELIASDMAFHASMQLLRAGTDTCGEIDPELLSDLDIAALRWAGVDPYNHSTWAVHRGDCRR